VERDGAGTRDGDGRRRGDDDDDDDDDDIFRTARATRGAGVDGADDERRWWCDGADAADVRGRRE